MLANMSKIIALVKIVRIINFKRSQFNSYQVLI